ncbi:MAG: hypothetical protein R3358_10440 [Woeseiaceae bacterium]|nr:hypothetical protein [Woeseiaceae bacterium]
METEPANTQSPRHRLGSVVFGLVVGLAVAAWSYQWVTDPQKRAERELQENVVLQSRAHVASLLAIDGLEFVDPLAPDRSVGKVYIYPAAGGWEVSGYYRRDDSDAWHAYLISLDDAGSVTRLRVRDQAVAMRAAADARLEVVTD